MAADYITINRSKQLGNNTVRLAELLKEARDLSIHLNATASHSWDTGDYTVLEANFGLNTGTGSNFLSLINLVDVVLNKSDEVPGANRLAWLDEFIARVAGQ